MKANKKKHYSYLNLFIRSLLFSIYSCISIGIYSLVVVFFFFLPLNARHFLIRGFLHAYFFMLKHICHIDYRVEGLENIPKDQAGVVLSKHQSTFETFLLPLLFHNPVVIVKRELLWVPFFGWGLAVAKPIAINRSNRSTAMQQVFKKGKEYLDEGRWVLLFPEGTRTTYGTAGQYRLGGARLAVETKHSVIPVAHNAGYFWPRRTFIKRPGVVTFVIGPAIDTTNLKAEEVLDRAKNWIEGTMVRIDGLIDKTTR